MHPCITLHGQTGGNSDLDGVMSIPKDLVCCHREKVLDFELLTRYLKKKSWFLSQLLS